MPPEMRILRDSDLLRRLQLRDPGVGAELLTLEKPTEAELGAIDEAVRSGRWLVRQVVAGEYLLVPRRVS